MRQRASKPAQQWLATLHVLSRTGATQSRLAFFRNLFTRVLQVHVEQLPVPPLVAAAEGAVRARVPWPAQPQGAARKALRKVHPRLVVEAETGTGRGGTEVSGWASGSGSL